MYWVILNYITVFHFFAVFLVNIFFASEFVSETFGVPLWSTDKKGQMESPFGILSLIIEKI